jgi:hypothetical protein
MRDPKALFSTNQSEARFLNSPNPHSTGVAGLSASRPLRVSLFLDSARPETWKPPGAGLGQAGEYFFLAHFVSGSLTGFP